MTTTVITHPNVRMATPSESESVSCALTAAFHDDPVFGWLLPDRAIRSTRLRKFFDIVVDILLVHDDTWTTSDGVTGAALWVPYGSAPMSGERGERFAEECAAICDPYADRVLELLAAMDERHPHEPHEYLWFAGVVPTAQGRGIGSALMAPVLERADRAGRPAYLEATSPRSKALYERRGFQASEPFSVADGPPLWPMWRDPV